MCGRYYLHSDLDRLTQAFGQLHAESRLEARYNIAPSQPVPVIYADADGRRHLRLMRWGLIPAWSKTPDSRYKMINARAETIAEKPAYRAAFRYRRCILPADGFYEWQQLDKHKQPYRISRADHMPLALAGIWEHWTGPDGEELDSCSIIVRAADRQVSVVHDRMPVILAREQLDNWLDRHQQQASLVLPLLEQNHPPDLELVPVSTRVNRPTDNSPELLEPLQHG